MPPVAPRRRRRATAGGLAGLGTGGVGAIASRRRGGPCLGRGDWRSRLMPVAGFDGWLFGGRGLAWQPAGVPDEPVPGDAAGLRAANARLRDGVSGLQAELGAEREPRGGWSCNWRNLSGGWGWTARTPGRRHRRRGSRPGRRGRPGSGRSQSGSAVRAGGLAGSSATRGRAWPGTRARASGRTRRRRRSAAGAGAWTGASAE
jgi:hypothetical protein